ncbi:MAG: HNH endonuclease [Pseudomonadota bacterium]
MLQCVLLNADYSFLNIVDWKKALRLVIKDKAEVIRFSDRSIHGVEGMKMMLPSILRLSKMIRTIYRNPIPFSKKNVLLRDGFRCAYCGRKSRALTIDHIVPRSRSGKTNFENCVASCRNCNSVKGCRTPREAGIPLKVRPYQPTIFEFIRIKLNCFNMDTIMETIMEGR